MEKISFKPGQYVFKAGDIGKELFLIISGEVGIYLPTNIDKEPNFRVGANEVVGEMGVIEDAPRMASVRCMSDCTLVKLTKAEYEKKLEDADPFLRGLLRVLSSRLRSSNKPKTLSASKN